MDRNDGNLWSVAPSGDYPYVSLRSIDLPSPPLDRHPRSIASLLSSIGAFANKVTKSPSPDFTIDEIKRIGRVCQNVMTMEDYLRFYRQIFAEPTRESTLIMHLNLLKAEDISRLPNLSEYQDIILSTETSTGDVFLLLILTAECSIDTYCITPVQAHEMKEPLEIILGLL